MGENNISVKNLCKSFDGFTLDNVSLQVPKGRIVGFIGENGAGKSTTINLILNELRRDSGTIEILGTDTLDSSVKKDIGVVFDECNFHECFTAQNVAKIFSRVYHTWDYSLFNMYMKKYNLPFSKPISSFSKGMKTKLSIICAVAHKPKLLILDEATSGLDPVMRDEILSMFLDFIQDEERSIFFSSHIISDIEKIADYVILIHHGKIVFEEEKDNLIDRYGIIRCERKQFTDIQPEDYIISRKTKVSVECLVRDKKIARRKYHNFVVDSASLEEIMLFYIKEDFEEGKD